MEVFGDALTAEQRKNLKDSDFALPEKRMFPIHNKTHIKMAWDMVDRAKGLTSAERDTARKSILQAAKKEGIDTSDWDKSAMTDAVYERAEVLLDSANTEQASELPQGVIMRVRCRGTRSDVVNAHNRTYPRNVMMDGLENAKGKWDAIESPHPTAFTDAQGNIKFRTSLDNRVGRIHGEPWMDSDGWVWFDADIFDTTKGRNIAALVRAGEPVGVSARNIGNSVKKVLNDSVISVATKLLMKTFDFVPDPATEGCGTDQVVLTDSELQVINDGLSFNDPVCPLDGALLQPIDPDKDDDVDYWACPKCNSRYDVYNGVQVQTSSNQTVYRRWDSPQYGADRTEATPPGGAQPVDGPALAPNLDSQTTPEGASEVTPEEIRAMIAQATQPFQTMLDAQQHAEQAAAAKAEAKAFLDSKLEEVKANYKPEVLQAIRKAVGEPQNKQAAEIVLDSVLEMAGQVSANDFLSALGFNAASSPTGNARVQVTNEPKPWQTMVDSMLQEFDRIDIEKGKKIDYALREHNKDLVNKVVNRFEMETTPGGYQAMKDSYEEVTALLDSGASVTTGQMLNQPSIQTVILIQKFQDLVATQFMMSDVFEGSEMRVPSESFQSAEAIDPATFLYDITVSENNPIPEAVVDLVWASFTPQARRNAISLTSDVIRAMGTGPLKYDAPARAIYHIGKEAARMIDSYAYWDMAVSADEYLPLVVSNETVTTTAVSNGTNQAYKGQLTLGGKANTVITNSDGSSTQLARQGYTPIVRPRTKQVIQPNGTVQKVTTNTITCKVGGTTLVQGGLDKNGNVVGTGAQFAINFETGDIYFITGLGINPGTVDPVISYSASTNYDIWSTVLGSGYTVKEQWYNTLLMQITNSNSVMASDPRYNPANLALFSLANAAYVRNAEMFYKWANPNGVSLNANQSTTQNFFGTRDEVDLYKLNAPWVLGDSRILLHQKGATRYGIQTPYKVEGPIQKQDPSTGRVLPVKAWYGEEFSCICTPQIIDSSGNVINPTSRTIRVVNY